MTITPESEYRRENEHPAWSETLGRRLGLIEVRPEEKPFLAQTRPAAYFARTSLRLGEESLPLIGELPEFPTEESWRLRSFANHLRACLEFGADDVEFSSVFPQVNPVLLKSTIRRIVGYPGMAKIIRREHGNESDGFNLALRVLDREFSRQEEERAELPSVLMIGHLRNPDKEIFVRKGKGIRFLLNGGIKGAYYITGLPYQGMSIIASELETTKKTGRIEAVDMEDCLQEAEPLLEALNPRYVFLTGVCSMDVNRIPQIVEKYQGQGRRVLIGGLAPTIDPEVFLRACPNANIFIGEAEGAMEMVMEILENARPDERYIFHRGLEATYSERYVNIVDEKRPKDVHVYLNLPERVDRERYYSVERERNGQLHRRLRWQAKMVSSFTLFGREWEGPGPLGAISQDLTSVGCPEGCMFCSTVSCQGTEMRRKPVKTIELSIGSMEGRILTALDQNFGGLNRSESEERKKEMEDEWYRWMMEFFGTMARYNKRLLCQTELEFFGHVAKYPELERLVRKVLFGALVGLEVPARIKGTINKEPEHYKEWRGKAERMKVLIVGTAIAGVPSEFLVGGKPSPTTKEITVLVREVRPDVLAVFPLIEIPGSAGIPQTGIDEEDPLIRYQGRNMFKAESLRMANEVNSDFYQKQEMAKRILWLLARRYSLRRIASAVFLNMGAKYYIKLKFL